MEAIVRAAAEPGYGGAVVAVIANRADAAGLAYARERGIATDIVEHARFDSRDAFDAALADAIDARSPDVIALAGFMRILGDAFVRRYDGRMVNVHPSLLPAFTGLKTHQRAIDAGCKVHGASVHFVTPALDHGPLIAQAAVPVLPEDTAQTLADRVLEREHVMYPAAIGWLARGELRLAGGVVTHALGVSQLF